MLSGYQIGFITSGFVYYDIWKLPQVITNPVKSMHNNITRIQNNCSTVSYYEVCHKIIEMHL